MKLPYREAQRLILSRVHPLDAREVALEEAWNTTLAEDVSSPLDLPPTDTSAMDGYALVASSTQLTPTVLKVVGEAPAGCIHPPSVRPGEAVLVTTGGPIPPGADAVVKVEEVEEDGETIILRRTVEKGELINLKGQDVSQGDLVLTSGTLLDYRKVALLASLGIGRVKVFITPKAALIATGDELLEPGTPQASGKVYNTNRYIVEGLLRKEGLQVDYLGIVPDHPQSLREILAQTLEKYPLVITMGAVSKGKYDYLRKVLKELQVELLITSTNIKPGHPLAFGTKGRSLFFGLPGYPSATLVNALVYLLPAVKRMSGRRETLPYTLRAMAGETFKSRKGKVYFIRVNLRWEGERLMAYSAGSQLTSNYLTSALCQGLAVIPEKVGTVERGEMVKVIVP